MTKLLLTLSLLTSTVASAGVGGGGGGTRPETFNFDVDNINVDLIKVIGRTGDGGFVFNYKPVESNIVSTEVVKISDANLAFLNAFKKSEEAKTWVSVNVKREPPRVPSWCELNPLSPACTPGSGPNAPDECGRNPIAPGCQPGQ